MPLPVDYQSLSAGALLESLRMASEELGILKVSDAPLEELRTAEEKCNVLHEEVFRRMSW